MTDALTWIKSVCRQTKKTKHKRNAVWRCKNNSKPRQTSTAVEAAQRDGSRETMAKPN